MSLNDSNHRKSLHLPQVNQTFEDDNSAFPVEKIIRNKSYVNANAERRNNQN